MKFNLNYSIFKLKIFKMNNKNKLYAKEKNFFFFKLKIKVFILYLIPHFFIYFER